MLRWKARTNHYRFMSEWRLDRPCDEVFHALQDLLSYPSWWPEVKKVTMEDGSSATVAIRAMLPYSLRFQLDQQRVDAEQGVLQASMSGDLEGWSRWSIFPGEGECLLKFEEEVRVNRPLLKALSPIARPLLRANHAVMMRRGERGLRRFLSRSSERSPALEGPTAEV